MNDPQTPPTKLYFNGFQWVIGPTDASLVLLQDGKPVLGTVTTLTVAKTMGQFLPASMDEFEQGMGLKIKTLPEIQERIQKTQKGSPSISSKVFGDIQ